MKIENIREISDHCSNYNCGHSICKFEKDCKLIAKRYKCCPFNLSESELQQIEKGEE